MSTADNILNTGNPINTPIISATPATSGDIETFFNNSGYGFLGGVTGTDQNGLFEIRTPNQHSVTPPTGTGNATVFQPFGAQAPDSGFAFKCVLVVLSNLRNTSNSKYTLALPSPFLASYFVWTSQCTLIELLSNGRPQTFNSATGIGTCTTGQVLGQFSYASGIGPVDSIRFAANDQITSNGVIVLLGV